MELLREGYHERLFLLTDEGEGLIVRKQAKTASSTLLTEIVWLEELPPSLHRYFPRVLRSSKADGNDQALFYDMPYFDHEWVLLSELILNQTFYPTQTLRLISQVMQVMFDGIFPFTYTEEEPDYPEKLVRLLERSAQQITQLSSFSPLIHPEAFLLNGERVLNVFPLLGALQRRETAQNPIAAGCDSQGPWRSLSGECARPYAERTPPYPTSDAARPYCCARLKSGRLRYGRRQVCQLALGRVISFAPWLLFRAGRVRFPSGLYLYAVHRASTIVRAQRWSFTPRVYRPA